MLISVFRNLCFCLFLTNMYNAPLQACESCYPVNPVSFTKVEIKDHFWNQRITTNKHVTIPYVFGKSEETGRLDNFRIAGGLMEGTFRTRRGFDDSDVFKIVEGASYSLITHPDKELEAYLDDLIAAFAAAQEDDGYLYTARTILGDSINTGERIDDDINRGRWLGVEHGTHELYNVGHMYEAAVAHFEATGKRCFLDIAIKNANLVYDVFGEGKLELIPGHQEIEIGLIKLYTVTGDERYLNLCKFFLEIRGRTANREEYRQSHKPVTEQFEAVGHAVRALYMYAGMADIAALTGNDQYLYAMERLWEDITEHKLYITGGVGSPRGASEGFAANYILANSTAYCETCAAIAMVFWNHRLFLTYGDSKYIDLLELSLYNNVLSGVSLSGDRFFYPNKLESDGRTLRGEWFNVSCCPTNISRFIPAVPGYIYAQKNDAFYVNLFISSETTLNSNNSKVTIGQNSSLPWGGRVVLNIDPEHTTAFPLNIRIPSWVKDRPIDSDLYRYTDKLSSTTSIYVNGKKLEYIEINGYAVIDREWSAGDIVEIDFPFEVRKITANQQVLDNIGRIALQVGPVVYCIEGHDYPNQLARNIYLPNDPLSLEFQKDLLGGVQTIKGRAVQLTETASRQIEREEVRFTAIPYYGWANRGRSEMLTWIPAEESTAIPHPYPTIASKSKVETSKEVRAGNIYVVNDLVKPRSQATAGIPSFGWWPLTNTTESITYLFEESEEVSESTVFFVNYTGESLPVSWKIYYKNGNRWREVETTSEYKINQIDGHPSKVTFRPVRTDAIKLEIQIGRTPGGVYEWEVF